MLETSIAVVAAIALLMPGFIVAELSIARSARGPRSDLELSMRALSYTVVIHLAAIAWTAWLVRHVEHRDAWAHHVGAIALYVAVILVFVPIVLGSLLNRYLASVELADGAPSRWAAALGAGASRDAFDFAFQRRNAGGAWVICELVGHTEEEPRIVGGIYGKRSAIGQTPAPHDVYLEAVCTLRPCAPSREMTTAFGTSANASHRTVRSISRDRKSHGLSSSQKGPDEDIHYGHARPSYRKGL